MNSKLVKSLLNHKTEYNTWAREHPKIMVNVLTPAYLYVRPDVLYSMFGHEYVNTHVLLFRKLLGVTDVQFNRFVMDFDADKALLHFLKSEYAYINKYVRHFESNKLYLSEVFSNVKRFVECKKSGSAYLFKKCQHVIDSSGLIMGMDLHRKFTAYVLHVKGTAQICGAYSAMSSMPDVNFLYDDVALLDFKVPSSSDIHLATPKQVLSMLYTMIVLVDEDFEDKKRNAWMIPNAD